MAERIDTIIVGAGQAGLALSYHLTQQGREHVILEKNRVGESWRSQRWDSFCLVTPNWHLRLPGLPYRFDDPDGYLPRQEVVKYLEEYAASFGAPVRTGIKVDAVEMDASGAYEVRSNAGPFRATNVAVATGSFRSAKAHPDGANLPHGILQLHCSEYRNPEDLPPGAVLVVGSAQSGCQIAEELYLSGRQVLLNVGSAGRIPRRYRGREIFQWLDRTGFFDQTVTSLPSPRIRFAGNPHVSGKNGGHNLNLHQFARDGVRLLGRLRGIDGSRIYVAPDLAESLAKVDQFEKEILDGIDQFIEKSGTEAGPPDRPPLLRDGYEQEVLTELDLEEAGVRTVIWAQGFGFDFSWVHLPALDDAGYPVSERGVTKHPGLYFIGLHWLHTRKSGIFRGVGEDAEYIAGHIATRP